MKRRDVVTLLEVVLVVEMGVVIYQSAKLMRVAQGIDGRFRNIEDGLKRWGVL